MDHCPPNRPLSLREAEKYHLEPQDDVDCEGMPVDGHCGRGVFHDDVGSSPAGGSASSKQGKSCGDQASEAVLNGILHQIWAVGKEGRLPDSAVEVDSVRSSR